MNANRYRSIIVGLVAALVAGLTLNAGATPAPLADGKQVAWALGSEKFAAPGGENSISLRGTLVQAVSLCSGTPDSMPCGPVMVKNGAKTESITFTGRNGLLNGTDYEVGMASTGNTNWDRIINTAEWADVTPYSITLSGLTPGHRYQIELFLFDNRPLIGSRIQYYSGSEVDYSSRIRWDEGVSIIGIFTASETTRSIELDSPAPTLNAFILRDVTGIAGDPAEATAHTTATIDLSHLRIPDLTPKTDWSAVNPNGDQISVNAQCLSLNGKPWIMVAGELQPVRYPADYWEEQILKMKAGGLNTVSASLFWSSHEEEEGLFTWTGNRDIRRFVQLCARHGMFVFLQVGPYCGGDYIYGGLPPFLKGKGIKFRTNDPGYLHYVRRLYNQIGQQLAGLMFKDGGPVVAIQVESDFQYAPSSWGFAGEGGEEHMRILKRMAVEAGLVAPVYMCSAWRTPVPHGEFIPAYSAFPFMEQGRPSGRYNFDDLATIQRSNYKVEFYPVAMIAIGTGMLNIGKWRPVFPPESSEALAVVMAGIGSNLQGYYLYQGGTHFTGKHGTSNERDWLNYDYHCPLREFGNRRPAYDTMKPVNFFQSDFGDLLAPMVTATSPDSAKDATDKRRLRFAARAEGRSGFLFINNYQDRVQLPNRQGVSINLKFADSEERIPRKGGFDLKHNQSVILPFNLDLDGVRLNYAMAQLYTRTTSADGRTVFIFFVPDGFEGSYRFDSSTLETVSGPSARIDQESGDTIVKTEPGTSSLLDIQSKSGKKFQIMTLTRAQALTLTRQEIFGRQRIVLSANMAISADGKLCVSQIGESQLGFSVFPAPAQKLVAETGKLVTSEDGVFSHYSIELQQVKPAFSIDGLGSATVKISTKPSVLDGVSDVFLFVDYYGDRADLKHDGKLLCDDLFDRTRWQIGLKRFKAELAGAPLVLAVSPSQPIIEITDNMEVYSEVSPDAKAIGDQLVGTYEGASQAPKGQPEQGRVNSVAVLPEYAVWISATNDTMIDRGR